MEFLRGLSSWDFERATHASVPLIQAAMRGDVWIAPDLLRDGATTAYLMRGDTAGPAATDASDAAPANGSNGHANGKGAATKAEGTQVKNLHDQTAQTVSSITTVDLKGISNIYLQQGATFAVLTNNACIDKSASFQLPGPGTYRIVYAGMNGPAVTVG